MSIAKGLRENKDEIERIRQEREATDRAGNADWLRRAIENPSTRRTEIEKRIFFTPSTSKGDDT